MSFRIAGWSTGDAYFDADTGILLFYSTLWGFDTMFFLGEINYDFAQQVAFAEDGGPHTGFRSFVSEQSINYSGIGGGSVIMQSLVESRLGAAVEMRVQYPIPPEQPYPYLDDKNYCFLGDVPLVTRMDATQAPNYPPEQWNPWGQYLWWWLPRTASGNPVINVYNVPMVKTSDSPLTHVATESPAAFHFSTLWFDSSGYMTAFAAKGPDGLDVRPTDGVFQNVTSVDGVKYFRTVMAPHSRGDFDGNRASDVLWRHTVHGGVWIWPMDGTTILRQSFVDVVDAGYQIVGTGDFDGDGKADILWRHGTGGSVWIWLMDGGMRRSKAFVDAVDVGYQIVGVGDFDGDTKADTLWRHMSAGQVWIWLMNGSTRRSQIYVGAVDVGYQIVGVGDFDGDGKADILWRHGTLGQVWVWLMNGVTKRSRTWVATVPDTGYQVQHPR